MVDDIYYLKKNDQNYSTFKQTSIPGFNNLPITKIGPTELILIKFETLY